jgi:DNA-binding NarL/FixJ family response regulator
VSDQRIPPRPCRVLLVDENDAFLDGLTDWFEETSDIRIVGRAHSRPEVMARVRELDPDLVLIDTRLPDGNGFDVVRAIKTRSARPLAVMMSFHDSDHIRTTAMSRGADGCITKADIPKSLASYVATLTGARDTVSTIDPVSNDPTGGSDEHRHERG